MVRRLFKQQMDLDRLMTMMGWSRDKELSACMVHRATLIDQLADRLEEAVKAQSLVESVTEGMESARERVEANGREEAVWARAMEEEPCADR